MAGLTPVLADIIGAERMGSSIAMAYTLSVAFLLLGPTLGGLLNTTTRTLTHATPCVSTPLLQAGCMINSATTTLYSLYAQEHMSSLEWHSFCLRSTQA